MAKKSKKKTASKKGAKKIKFNKGTQYEVDYVWIESKKFNVFKKIWNWIKTQF
jgi:hypothetical protein